MEAKNPKAMKLTKVKGQATERMVLSGEATKRAQTRKGYDEAGAAAELGTTGERPTLAKLIDLFAERQENTPNSWNEHRSS